MLNTPSTILTGKHAEAFNNQADSPQEQIDFSAKIETTRKIIEKFEKDFKKLPNSFPPEDQMLTEQEMVDLLKSQISRVKNKWIPTSSGIFPETHSQHGRTFESDEVVVYADGEKFITRYIKEYDKELKQIIWQGWLLVEQGELNHTDITHWYDTGVPET